LRAVFLLPLVLLVGIAPAAVTRSTGTGGALAAVGAAGADRADRTRIIFAAIVALQRSVSAPLMRRLLLISVPAAVAALALAGSSGATFPGRNGRIVFADARTDQPGEGNSQIYKLDLASGRSRNLSRSLSDDGDLAPSPDGTQIAFVRAGHLWLMRHDGNDQRQLVDLAVSSGHEGFVARPDALAWSPDGSRIAFTGGSAHSLWLVDVGGSGLRELTSFETGGARWSPDGSEVAFAGFEDTDVGTNIGIIGADGAGLRWLPVLPELSGHTLSWSPPAWSLDGKELVFGRFDELVVVNADGSGERVLTTNAGSPEWLRSGDLISAIGRNGSNTTVELIHPDGTGLQTIAVGNIVSQVAWSPTGDRLAFARYLNRNGVPRRELVVEPRHGPERVLSLPGFLGKGYTDWTGGPAWSPDGESLLYSGVVAPRDSELFSITRQGGDLRQLTRDNLDDVDPVWSPDGRRIAFARRVIDFAGYPSSLYVMDADGGRLRRLTKPGYTPDPAPSWSPDNVHIVFARYRRRYLEIAILDTRTGRIRSLASDATDPAWSPDGRLIAFVWRSRQLRTVRTDGSGERTLFTSSVLRLHRPSWSPDGRSIAVTRLAFGKLSSYSEDQLIVSRIGGKRRRLPCGPPSAPPPLLGAQPVYAHSTDSVVWSPDGTVLAGSSGGAIWTCALGSSAASWLTAGVKPDWQPLH